MQQPDYSISTPENVDLHLEIAGLGNRLLAQLIDGLILTAVGLFVLLLGAVAAYVVHSAITDSKMQGIAFAVIVMVVLFLIFALQNCYFLVFEGVWRGQTPGKKIAQIRVIEQNGQPIGWAASFIRNLIRMVDSVMFLGILIILIDKDERRLGDMAAGTIVIRERPTEISTSKIKMVTEAAADTSLDVGLVTPAEYDLLVDFLRRRESLGKAHRPNVADKLATHFKDKLSGEDNGAGLGEPSGGGSGRVAVAVSPGASNSEEYLERLYLTYQQRAQD